MEWPRNHRTSIYLTGYKSVFPNYNTNFRNKINIPYFLNEIKYRKSGWC